MLSTSTTSSTHSSSYSSTSLVSSEQPNSADDQLTLSNPQNIQVIAESFGRIESCVKGVSLDCLQQMSDTHEHMIGRELIGKTLSLKQRKVAFFGVSVFLLRLVNQSLINTVLDQPITLSKYLEIPLWTVIVTASILTYKILGIYNQYNADLQAAAVRNSRSKLDFLGKVTASLDKFYESE